MMQQFTKQSNGGVRQMVHDVGFDDYVPGEQIGSVHAIEHVSSIFDVVDFGIDIEGQNLGRG